jgi:hypothetical protein
VTIRLGGYVPQGLTTPVVATWKLPWDCEVIGVDLDYTGIGSEDLDAITLKTVDSTALTLCTIGDMSADVVGVAQTLHSDIIGTNIVKGNKIQLVADSRSANEEGSVFVDVHLRPTRG